MTGNFSQKLELILSKFNCIEKTAKNIEESLSALDERTKKTRDFKESTTVDLEKLNQREIFWMNK